MKHPSVQSAKQSVINSRLDIAATVGSLESGITLVFIWFTIILTVVCMLVVYNTIKLGAQATGSTSGILKAADPYAMVEEMIYNLRKAWDELHP